MVMAPFDGICRASGKPEKMFFIHGSSYRLAVQSGSSLLHVKAKLKAL